MIHVFPAYLEVADNSPIIWEPFKDFAHSRFTHIPLKLCSKPNSSCL